MVGDGGRWRGPRLYATRGWRFESAWMLPSQCDQTQMTPWTGKEMRSRRVRASSARGAGSCLELESFDTVDASSAVGGW